MRAATLNCWREDEMGAVLVEDEAVRKRPGYSLSFAEAVKNEVAKTSY